MKWSHHFYLFGLGIIILIVASVLFVQTEGFDFNAFFQGVTTDLSGVVETLGIPLEVLLVVFLFIGILVILKAMTKA
ncbi:MAG: hypothetical protein ACFFB5_01440 [Promethearchaeota archaeon]